MSDLQKFHYSFKHDRPVLIVSSKDPQFPSDAVDLSDCDHFCVVPFEHLTPALILSIAPVTVISSAISCAFDCVDIAGVLAQAGYAGAYRIISSGLPDLDLVRNELSRDFPAMRFEIADALRCGQLELAT